jgi:hypothetical protein
MAFGPDGNLYVTETGTDQRVIRLDGNSGEFLDVFAWGHGLSRPYSLVFVPEPSTLVLLGTGVFGLLAWNRRRRRGRTARRPTGVVSAALACVLLISLRGSLAAAPVSPWFVNPANGHSYALLGQSDWINSEVEAISLGGHLTAIGDAAEQSWVYQTFGRYGGRSRLLWIGLSDADREGQFGFSNGEAMTYTYWSPGEPNNAGGSEDYVAMFYPGHSRQGRWNDWGHRAADPIGVPFHGVVEIGAEPQPPLFRLGTDSSWLAMAPEGNRQGRPIHSVGSSFEAGNPGWKSDLALDTSAWVSARPRPGGAIWGPGADTPVYLRKTFTLSDPVEDVALLAIADDDALIYVNGNLVAADASGKTSGLGPIDVTDYLLPGENLIAVKAHDSYGVGENFYAHLVGTVVPEPGTLALLGMGTVGLLGYAWRRRKRA